MNIRMLVLLTLFTFLIIQTGQAQSGWTQEKGKFYGQASIAHFSSNKFYGTQGTLFDGGSDFKSSILHLYGEYGISDRLTTILNQPLIINRFSTTESIIGLGSVDCH